MASSTFWRMSRGNAGFRVSLAGELFRNCVLGRLPSTLHQRAFFRDVSSKNSIFAFPLAPGSAWVLLGNFLFCRIPMRISSNYENIDLSTPLAQKPGFLHASVLLFCLRSLLKISSVEFDQKSVLQFSLGKLHFCLVGQKKNGQVCVMALSIVLKDVSWKRWVPCEFCWGTFSKLRSRPPIIDASSKSVFLGMSFVKTVFLCCHWPWVPLEFCRGTFYFVEFQREFRPTMKTLIYQHLSRKSLVFCMLVYFFFACDRF